MTSTNSNDIIGKNIKSFREQMGLTQESLAQYLGIAREQISYYENGTRSTPSAHISKLANLFCIEEHDFYDEDPETHKVNLAFAFRADLINDEDLASIAQFKKIVRNYLNMRNFAACKYHSN